MIKRYVMKWTNWLSDNTYGMRRSKGLSEK